MEIKRIQISKIIGSLCKMRLEKDYEAEELLEIGRASCRERV